MSKLLRFTKQISLPTSTQGLIVVLAALSFGSSGCGKKGGFKVTAGTTGSGTRDAAMNIVPPTIVSPATDPSLTNGTRLTFAGTCTSGARVHLREILLSGTATSQYVTCSGSSFSISSDPQASDGEYSYVLYQQAVFEGEVLDYYSTEVNRTWLRDATAPAAPTVTSLGSNPYMSAGNSITIAGACETDATVYLGGASTQTQVCANSSYSFTYSNPVDGSYDFTLRQVDPAGNGASAPNFSWIRESQPTRPVITSPATSPTYSNGDGFTLTGTCTSTYQVNLSGVNSGEVASPAGSLTQTCLNGAFSYTLALVSDASYSITVTQTNLGTAVSSLPASLTWIRDTQDPSAPTVTSIADPYYSSGNNVTIGGSCEPYAAVELTGASTQTATCPVGGTYSFSFSQSVDATYNFSVRQVDRALNASAAETQSWIRDTVSPASPTRTSPGSNPFTSDDNSITIAGACETGADVVIEDLAANSTDSMTCANSLYSFNVSKGQDGSYSFELEQTDRAGNASSPKTTFTWVRNTDAGTVNPPTISAPTADPHYSSTSPLSLSGTCTLGATVTLDGDVASPVTTTCDGSGNYAFSIPKAPGTYNFSVTQTVGPTTSTGVTRQWVLDQSAPAALAISGPGASPYYSKLDLLALSGTCEPGATVYLSGASTQSALCSAGGAFSFNVSKTSDAAYDFSLLQKDLALNSSTSISYRWTRDTLAPLIPTITSPSSSTYVSSGDLIISGECENGTTVALSGSVIASDILNPLGSLTRTCASSVFTFTVAKANGTYPISITQTDRAANDSESASVTWVKNDTTPAAPVISSPLQNPHYSSDGSVTISGTCTAGAGNVVNLTGDVSPIPTPAPCTAGTYSFSVAKGVDETYRFYLNAENTNTETISPQVSQTWVRDIVPPSAPVRLNPTSTTYSSRGDLLIQGMCEANATVYLTGTLTDQTACSASGTFSLTVAPSLGDGLYTLNVNQQDRALNSSSSFTLSWTHDSTLPPTPTITTPAINPYEFNGNSIIINGQCVTGYTVLLGGSAANAAHVTSPAGTLSQACANSTYSFTVAKTSDGNYDFTVGQSPNGSTWSGLIGVRWIRDVAPPVLSVTEKPASTNLALEVRFSFSTNETSTFRCSFNGAAFANCVSPVVYPALANGDYTFEIRATDAAGNIGNTFSHLWTQAAYKTVALYHLESASHQVDSSPYTGLNNNTLTTNSGNTSDTGKFGDGRVFSGNGTLAAADSSSLGAISRKLTVEAWVKVNGQPNGNAFHVLTGQSTAASHGWELRLRRGSQGRVKFGFYVSNGATTGFEFKSSAMTLEARMYHLAAVFDNGSVKLFLDGALIASGTSTAQTINNSTALLKIGNGDVNGTAASVLIDEVRVSQTDRYAAPFNANIPSQAFTPTE